MEAYEIICLGMFAVFILMLFSGYPVAWVLGGVSTLTALAAAYIFNDVLASGFYGLSLANMNALTQRIWGIMQNWLLVALPMFVFMGLMLDRSGVAEHLMKSFVKILGRTPGGAAITVAIIGIILAASTGIVGASVVLLALLGMPIMMQMNYNKQFAAGTVCAVGTLGILIPPSIMLVLMADRTPGVDAGGLFMGAMIPGVLLGLLYIAYMMFVGFFFPKQAPTPANAGDKISLADLWDLAKAVVPPSFLILAVLGSIFLGWATPTEAAGVGAAGAILLAILNRRFSLPVLRECCIGTTKTTAFIFAIFIGATAFSFVFQSLGGEDMVHHALKSLPFSQTVVLILILSFVFILGFFLDWIEISLIVLPIVAPVIAGMTEVGPTDPGARMIWFVVLVAVCLQTSFLTPPVGFSLFYFKGVAPPGVTNLDIYKGVVPFIALQVLCLALVFIFPALATWLPEAAYGPN